MKKLPFTSAAALAGSGKEAAQQKLHGGGVAGINEKSLLRVRPTDMARVLQANKPRSLRVWQRRSPMLRHCGMAQLHARSRGLICKVAARL